MLVVSHQAALWLMISPAVNQRARRRIRESLALDDYRPVEQIKDTGRSTPREHAPELRPITTLRALELWEGNSTGVSIEMLGTLHFLVPRGTSRRQREGARTHQWSGRLPAGSTIEVAKGISICTPEFCFLQMAATLDCAQLAQLGMALCGAYYPASTQRGFLDCPALTTPERILDFLSRLAKSQHKRGCQGLHGFARATRVARYLVGAARSPLEGSTVIALHFPRSMGGYGFTKPVLNAPVRLSSEAACIFGRTPLRPDIRFAEQHLSVECLGKAYHKHPDRDIRRELALRHDGDKVILLGYEQMASPPQREEALREIAQGVGKRIRALPSRFANRQAELLGTLFPTSARMNPDGSRSYAKPPWALPARLASAA